ncbi:hypothetical protein A2630_04910 [Candidatus Woesebacteria bacterium RIFCSPHIGHO2_01_FULL_44_10]|nr:MAG: hypothetical protein A2630_04910 [Candidatus Woesebacteria bacterium RIFCSPHIGHO2_01_FULL_44_10]
MIAGDVSKALRAVATVERAKAGRWFFKTGIGEYGEGDQFLGVTVPDQRKIAKQFKDLPLTEIEKLITSSWHEERLTGIFILIDQFKRGDDAIKKAIYDFYISHTKYVNNWDLVDSSAGYIVGTWLDGQPDKMKVLTKLAKSKLLWERRIAMISTLYFIVKKESVDEALTIIEILKNDNHDLIQKAVGWMLREVGKRVDEEVLTNFLDQNAATLPRTTLRYAIEKLTPSQRRHYLGLKDV